MLLHVSVLLSIALVVVVYGTDLPECKNIPPAPLDPVSSMVCPKMVVCGDEWDTIRDWYNGTRCREHRVNLRCVCPGDKQCPVGNARHRFYSNSKHSRYLCESKCDLDLCTTGLIAAVELVQNSPALNGQNFYKINCRCPGHDSPIPSVPGSMMRTTSYKSRTRDYRTGIIKTQYRCNPKIPFTGEDICL